MKWTSTSEKKLLDRAFLMGLLGIILSLIPLIVAAFALDLSFYSGWLNGPGIACQLFAMILTVLLLRKRKIAAETKKKAKQMTLILAVSLLFFFLI
jgi:hypothetical protein